MTQYNKDYLVEFKLKDFTDHSRWEEMPVIGFLYCDLETDANEAAEILSGVFNKQCRWNWIWSGQGHYISHPETWSNYLSIKKVNPDT